MVCCRPLVQPISLKCNSNSPKPIIYPLPTLHTRTLLNRCLVLVSKWNIILDWGSGANPLEAGTFDFDVTALTVVTTGFTLVIPIRTYSEVIGSIDSTGPVTH